MLKIRRYHTADATFEASLHQLLAFEGAQDDKIDVVVADILADVKKRGDAAVLEYTQRFDGLAAASMAARAAPRSHRSASRRRLRRWCWGWPPWARCCPVRRPTW